MTEIPTLLAAAVVAAAMAFPLVVGAAIGRGARAAGTGRRRARRVGWATALVLGAWLVVTAVAAVAGVFAADPWMGVGVVVPLLLGLPALRLPVVAAAVRHAGAALVAVQALRIVGGAFLVLLALDRLPPGFAVPAGAGDVLVGVLAPAVGYALWRRPSRRGLGFAFNALGLLDLALAIPLGLLHAPGRLQLIVTEPTTAIMGVFPVALIPAFVVPLAVLCPIASIRAIAAAPDGGSRADAAVRPTPAPAVIDLAGVASALERPWTPRTVAVVNGDYDIRVVTAAGEFTPHSHPDTDEAFLVIDGHLTIRMRAGDVELGPGQLYVVPRGVGHQPVSSDDARIVLFEPSPTVNTGDAPGHLTARRQPI